MFFLRQIAYSRSCAICHINDNHEIAEELLRATENNPTSHPFLWRESSSTLEGTKKDRSELEEERSRGPGGVAHVHGLEVTDLSAAGSIGVLLCASISDLCFVVDSSWEHCLTI